MIIKKLLVPFINEKILQNAEHCYIASAAISEPAFDLIMSKLSPKCKLEIVTGLDLPTHPNVLRKALQQYPGRIILRIHTRNLFHPNVYIFDLPYRKMAAFIGSGSFTMGGFKDNEELSYKIDTEKGVEEIKSWFRSHFEYAQDLTEKMITKYEEIYPSIVEREATSKREKQEFIESSIGSFNWDTAKLNGQYFQQEDYMTFENRKAPLDTPVALIERAQVQNKLLELHDQLKSFVNKLNLHEHSDSNHIVSSVNPIDHYEDKVKSMWLAYGRDEKELTNYHAKPMDMMRLLIIVRQNDFGIWLLLGQTNSGREDRDYFRNEMKNEEYRQRFFDLLKVLGEKYWIDIAGEKRKIASFENENKLWEFTTQDCMSFYFTIGRTYLPNDTDISSGKILTTIQEEFAKLHSLYRLMKDKSFEK